MSRLMNLFGLFLLVANGACDCKTEPQTTPPTNPQPVREVSKIPDAAPPLAEKKTDPCAQIIADYTKVLETADLTCKKDDDCGCYSGGMGPRSGCGGVVNRKTLAKLMLLWQHFMQKRCQYTRNCARRACMPRCHEGQCVQATVGHRTVRRQERLAWR